MTVAIFKMFLSSMCSHFALLTVMNIKDNRYKTGTIHIPKNNAGIK